MTEEEEEAQAFMNKTLEDFYRQADDMFSPNHLTPRQSRSRSAKKDRVKSAPPKVTNVKATAITPKLGHQIEGMMG